MIDALAATRRTLLAGLATALWPRAGLGASAARAQLGAARTWGCQYQAVDLAALRRSPLDLVVVDPSLDDAQRRFLTADDVAALRRKPDGGRRIVLAYLSVGEADVTRWFWPDAWRARPPAWLGRANPDWPGARHVAYWHPEWRDLVFAGSDSLLDHILARGFDGALLDRVDAYGDHPDPHRGERAMLDLVASLARKARAAKPDFLLMPQNAEHMIAHRAYLDAIDGLNKESLLTGLDGPGVANRPSDTQWSLARLRQAEAAGVAIFVTEYVAGAPDAAQVAARVRALGFRPFIATRALDRLPSAPGA